VEHLLSIGAYINNPDEGGLHPLHNGNSLSLSFVANFYLLHRKMYKDLQFIVILLIIPLLACSVGHSEVVRTLLARGADVNARYLVI